MSRNPARILFLGTPDFAVPCLEALLATPAFVVIGVVTQPDRPAGRGQQLLKSAVKLSAEKNGIAIFQPETLRDTAAVERLRSWSPDVLAVAAFGQILRQPVLDLAPYGCINVHASLLPRWRGAAPIQYAIRAGDAETGVTLMKMDAGLDTGPILTQRALAIAPDETGSSLHDKLAALGAELLPGVLTDYLAGKNVPRPQPESGVTLAPTLKKSDGQIDWSQPAEAIDRQVRAYTPWPGTYTFLGGALLKIVRGAPLKDQDAALPGTVVLRDGYPAVQTGEGMYLLREVQPAGKPRMDGAAFVRGHADVVGMVLSASGRA